MVYSCAVCLLVTANNGHQYRGKAKGLLANVYTSHYHNDVDFYQLRLPSDQGCQSHSLHNGRWRRISCCKSTYV